MSKLSGAIKWAAGAYVLGKAMEVDEKVNSEIMSGKRNIICDLCHVSAKYKATCSRTIICAKDLCSNCAKKCRDCGKYFCNNHVDYHSCSGVDYYDVLGDYESNYQQEWSCYKCKKDFILSANHKKVLKKKGKVKVKCPYCNKLLVCEE